MADEAAKVEKRRLSDISELKQIPEFNSNLYLKTRRNAFLSPFIADRFSDLQYRFPRRTTASTTLLPKEYGSPASDIIGLVMNTFAIFPTARVP